MLEGEQGGEATTSGSVLHVALGVWFRGEYGGAGDWVTVRSLPALMTLAYTEMPPAVTALFKGLEGRIQVPCTLKIPAVHPLVLLPLLMVVHLPAGKGFALLFPSGWRLGEHNQTHSALPIPFPKDTKSAPNRSVESPASQQGKAWTTVSLKALLVFSLCLWPKAAWKFKGRLAP